MSHDSDADEDQNPPAPAHRPDPVTGSEGDVRTAVPEDAGTAGSDHGATPGLDETRPLQAQREWEPPQAQAAQPQAPYQAPQAPQFSQAQNPYGAPQAHQDYRASQPQSQQPGPYPSVPHGPNMTQMLPFGQAPTQPAPTGKQRAAVPGWTWPAVAVLALVVGLVGGALGAGIERELNQPGSSVSSGPGRVTTAPPLEEGNTSVAAVAASLLPSTLQVLAADGTRGGTGSGFVLDDSGHVVTNNHVVAEAAESGDIQVVDSNGRARAAEVVGHSRVYDLAVLKVQDAEGLSPAALGASQELLVGESVVAFGAPLGLSQTVTSGIVSALNRPVTTGSSSDETSFINAVQTDAAINPGNSGGPLVNLAGQVVGVNTAIATTGGFGESGNIGVGFAIPIEQVRVTAEQILTTGEARYPIIGASVDTSRDDARSGARITGVTSGSPAETAGLEADDVVVAINDVAIGDGITLIVQIRTYRPDDDVELTVRRGDDEITVDVKLGSEVG